MKPASQILQKVRRGVQSVTYGNPLYQKILASGEGVDYLHFTKPDPWPGDSDAGMSLISDQRNMFENSSGLSLRHAAVALRNLRAVGTDTARQMSVQLIENWLRQYDAWSESEWAPHVLGERIAGWIGHYEFYAPLTKSSFTQNLTSSLYRQWKHLVRTFPSSLVGMAGLQAIRGLIYGGLNFPEGDKALVLALDMLERQLACEIHPDGGHISRNPSIQLHVLRHLVDVRSILMAAGLEIPAILSSKITLMVPALKLFRHGDGELALFHGSIQETALLVDAVITQAETRGRILRRLPDTGYERITSGRSLLLADVSSPAGNGFDRSAHAGLMSFEFAHGRERLIVNCGSIDASPEWRMALAATAAHSTVTLEDTNACYVNDAGGLSSVPRVEAHRYEQDNIQFIDITHDGYQNSFGIQHQRTLGLTDDGEALYGRDILRGRPGCRFAVRWHVHPSVQVSLTQGGKTALLRTASGAGWRLGVEMNDLVLEPSIYCGRGSPQRGQQLKSSGVLTGDELILVWKLAREKK